MRTTLNSSDVVFVTVHVSNNDKSKLA